jgi:hypothetical protein
MVVVVGDRPRAGFYPIFTSIDDLPSGDPLRPTMLQPEIYGKMQPCQKRSFFLVNIVLIVTGVLMKRPFLTLFAFSLGLLFATTPTPTLSHSRSNNGPGANGSALPHVTVLQPGGVVDVPEEEFLFYLPLIAQSPLTAPYDILPFLLGDWRLYEVQHSQGSQARHQTQLEAGLFFHTKGHEIKAEWEELWATEEYIYRGTDTSPGHEKYYTLRDPGMYGSAWAPRYWREGELFYRNPLVTFYYKSNCSVVPGEHGYFSSYLQFDAYYPSYTFDSGITLANVIQLAWLLEPGGEVIERYFYGYDYGLIGWWSNDRGMSYISEIHEPGQRPDNNREVISCLDQKPASLLQRLTAGKLPYWPGEHRR